MKRKLLITVVLVWAAAVAMLGLAHPDASTAVGEPWWNTNWAYRVGIDVDADGYARVNKPVEVDINFTTLLNGLGETGSLETESIRVVEINGAGVVVVDNVPFQFDKADNYHATNNARGTLVFLMQNSTGTNATRRYHVYFDVAGAFTPPSFTPLVSLTDGVTHKGYESIRIETAGAEYFYHKPGGGFATLLDKNNKDWLGWGPAVPGIGGEANDFRGIPNMVHPNDGGYFHPGRNTASTTVLRKGPLKVTFKSVSEDNKWEALWDIFPGYARMTLLKVDPGKQYWFLYEGTPGGVLEVNSDTLTRSDGETILASEKWTTDIPGEEWLFVSDPNLNRSIFLIHHQVDELVDGYYPSTPNNLMTIFGFGRSGNSRYLNGLPRQFTYGLVDSTAIGPVGSAVRNAYKPLAVSLSAPEQQPGGLNTYTPTPTKTPKPTNTATYTATPTATATQIASATPTVTQAPLCSEAFCLFLPFITGDGSGN